MPAASRRLVTFAVLAAVAPLSAALAQDDDFDRSPEDCITVNSIDRTDVIDDNTIIFFMRGSRIYRNYLPRRCPGLERHDRFSYRTTGGRLCDIDTITVLEQWGGRLQPGFTCSLGEFHPVTQEEVEDLERLAEEGSGRSNAIESEPAELPDDEDSDEAPDDEAAAPRD